jgi:biopolymer transport protein ExbB
MRQAMARALDLELHPELQLLLAPILALAKISTMAGLLGTVISMINTFDRLQANADSSSLIGPARAIGLALFATAFGLVTAIPLVFAHVLFRAWVRRFETKAKIASLKLLDLVDALPQQPPPALAPAASIPPVRATAAHPSQNAIEFVPQWAEC